MYLDAKIIYKKLIGNESVDSHKEFSENGLKLNDVMISFLNLSNYKNLLNFLGVDEFNIFLQKINDINYLNYVNKFPHDEEILLKTLLRKNESYDVFKNFDEVYVRDNYTKPERIRVGDVGEGFLELKKNIDCVNGNIFGLIGVNGIGKSYTLKNIAKNILNSDDFYRIFGLSTTKENDKTFEDLNKSHAHKFKFFDSEFVSNKNIANIIYDISRLNEGNLTKFLKISQMVLSYEELIFEDNDGDIHRMRDIYLGNELSVLLRKGFVNKLTLKIVKDTGIPREPSSGEIACLKIISAIFSVVRNDSIFLFEEIENHLHPNYITRILFSISKILREFNCVAVFSTHSPYVVREMIDSNVFILKRSPINKKLEFIKPGIKTLGADLQELSNFIFEDEFVSLVLINYLRETGTDVNELNYVPESAKIIINSGL